MGKSIKTEPKKKMRKHFLHPIDFKEKKLERFFELIQYNHTFLAPQKSVPLIVEKN